MIASAINFLKKRLETSRIMTDSVVLEPRNIANAIASMERQSYLLSYGKKEIESRAKQYPDLNKGDIVTGWIAVKDALTHISNLDQLNLLSLLPKLCELSKHTCLDAEEYLRLIGRIVAVSPHNNLSYQPMILLKGNYTQNILWLKFIGIE